MVEPEMLLEILCTLHTRYQYTYISMFSMHTQWKRDFRALIFCHTSGNYAPFYLSTSQFDLHWTQMMLPEKIALSLRLSRGRKGRP